MPIHTDLILKPKLNVLISEIYKVSLNTSAWREVLRVLADFIGAAFTYAIIQEADGETVLCFSADPTADAAYRDHCAAARAAQRAATLTSIFDDQRDPLVGLPPPPWAPDALSHAVTCATPEHPRFAACLGAHPTAPGSEDADRVFSLLSPHISAALRMRRSITAQSAERALITRALDALPYGLLVIDQHAALIDANAAAQALLTRADAIHLDDQRRVRATHPPDDAALAAALRGAAPAFAMRLSCQGGPPLDLLLAPLPPTPDAPRALLNPTAFTLLLHDPAADATADLSAALARRCHLTEAERRVAACLLRGHAHKDIADELGIALATVRNHTQRVYEKAAVANQAELIATTLRSVYTLRQPAPPPTPRS